MLSEEPILGNLINLSSQLVWGTLLHSFVLFYLKSAWNFQENFTMKLDKNAGLFSLFPPADYMDVIMVTHSL